MGRATLWPCGGRVARRGETSPPNKAALSFGGGGFGLAARGRRKARIIRVLRQAVNVCGGGLRPSENCACWFSDGLCWETGTACVALGRHTLRMNRPALRGLPFGGEAEAEGAAGGGHVGGAERVEVVAVGQVCSHQLGGDVFADFVAQIQIPCGDGLPFLADDF